MDEDSLNGVNRSLRKGFRRSRYFASNLGRIHPLAATPPGGGGVGGGVAREAKFLIERSEIKLRLRKNINSI